MSEQINNAPAVGLNELKPFITAKTQINNLASQCKNFVVVDDSTLATAEELAKQSKKLEKLIDEKRKEAGKPYVDAKAKIDEYAKTLLSELNSGIKDLRDQILKYKQIQMQKAEEERKKQAAILAEQERIRLEKEAELAEAVKNNKEVSEEDVLAVESMKMQEAAIQKAVTNAPTPSGIRKIWTFEVEDLSKVPFEHLQLNEASVKAAISAGVREIPGIKIFQKDSLNLR